MGSEASFAFYLSDDPSALIHDEYSVAAGIGQWLVLRRIALGELHADIPFVVLGLSGERAWGYRAALASHLTLGDANCPHSIEGRGVRSPSGYEYSQACFECSAAGHHRVIIGKNAAYHSSDHRHAQRALARIHGPGRQAKGPRATIGRNTRGNGRDCEVAACDVVAGIQPYSICMPFVTVAHMVRSLLPRSATSAGAPVQSS